MELRLPLNAGDERFNVLLNAPLNGHRQYSPVVPTPLPKKSERSPRCTAVAASLESGSVVAGGGAIEMEVSLFAVITP
jgi:hypothetical protein